MANNSNEIFNDSDIFNAEDSSPSNNYSKKGRSVHAQKKQNEKALAYEILGHVTEEIARDESAFKGYLATHARLGGITVTNALLAYKISPNASKLRTERDWHNDGVSISKRRDEVMMFVPGRQYMRKNGTIGQNFNIEKYVDISQTSAEAKTAPKRKLRQPMTRYFLQRLLQVRLSASHLSLWSKKIHMKST